MSPDATPQVGKTPRERADDVLFGIVAAGLLLAGLVLWGAAGWWALNFLVGVLL